MTEQEPADHLLDHLHTLVQQRDTRLFDVGSHPRSGLPTEDVAITDCETGLIEAGARRALARLLATDAMLDLAAWVVAADRAGIERKRISQLSGLSRQGVYDVLTG